MPVRLRFSTPVVLALVMGLLVAVGGGVAIATRSSARPAPAPGRTSVRVEGGGASADVPVPTPTVTPGPVVTVTPTVAPTPLPRVTPTRPAAAQSVAPKRQPVNPPVAAAPGSGVSYADGELWSPGMGFPAGPGMALPGDLVLVVCTGALPTRLVVPPGSMATSTCQVTSQNGFAGQLSVVCEENPGGTTVEPATGCDLSSGSLTLTQGQSASISVTVKPPDVAGPTRWVFLALSSAGSPIRAPNTIFVQLTSPPPPPPPPATIPMPWVVGQSFETAQTNLKALGLEVFELVFGTSCDLGTVILQSVEPGRMLFAGYPVTLNVPSGPPADGVCPAPSPSP